MDNQEPTSNSELKLCPFCEHEPLKDSFKEDDEPPVTEAACVNPDCPIYMKGMSFEDWNNRPGSDSIGKKIKQLGGNFRGLWVSTLVEDGVTTRGWACTVTKSGEYIENPYSKTPEEALDLAIETLKKMPDKSPANDLSKRALVLASKWNGAGRYLDPEEAGRQMIKLIGEHANE